ncbi:kinase-like protein [Exidia glandulosa HHB12029]|uniref:Kinase-like protein n=1 Tax=Exidia glandulosa HHB12029 TaxID=1314781 RepID=A0A165DGD5_EXIGL|nr:kinase-like protein [Exidia glandulosa HHB12029]
MGDRLPPSVGPPTSKSRNTYLPSIHSLEFVDSVHTLLALQHPNLLRIYGTSSSRLDTFVISPFLELTPVFVRIDDCHSLERRPIVLGVARALAYLHSHDIIHGGLDAYHVFLSPSNEVILDGFAPLGRPVASVESSRSATLPEWANPVQDLAKSEKGLDPEADASDDPEWDPPYQPPRVPDSELEEPLRSEVRNYLRSTTKDGDIFTFGFFIVEIFTGLAPFDCVYALRLLRMVINGQQPRHPGRLAEVRGLDERHWDLCLRCWDVGPGKPVAMRDIVAALEAPRDDIVRCPVLWNFSYLEKFTARMAPDLTRRVQRMQTVESGRDIECEGFELHAVVRGDVKGVRIVNLIPPHAYRRLLSKQGTKRAFLSELVVWSQLKHAHILPLLGSYIGTGDTRQCFVVPRMAGGTCVDYLRECDSPDRMRILSEVADAVHARVFISTAGTAFLGNFDFSPLQRPVANRFDDTDTCEIVQSMRWTAPEATRDPSTRSDVFAFGMFGYETKFGLFSERAGGEQPLRVHLWRRCLVVCESSGHKSHILLYLSLMSIRCL